MGVIIICYYHAVAREIPAFPSKIPARQLLNFSLCLKTSHIQLNSFSFFPPCEVNLWIPHTGFPDVARPQHHNLHRLVGHTVQQGILRYGHQQKVAGPAAAVHGSRCRVASQPHLAPLCPQISSALKYHCPAKPLRPEEKSLQYSLLCSCRGSVEIFNLLALLEFILVVL